MGNRALLLVEYALLRQALLIALRDERGVRARVRGRRFALEMQNVIDDVLQECPIVTDEEHGHRRFAKELLEPTRRLQVEVIRRLVEQKHLATSDQFSGQTETPPFASTQLPDGRRARLLRLEPESVQYSIDS